jgi:hypothetical protein
VVLNVRERLEVSEQRAYGLHKNRFNLKNLKKVEDEVWYRAEIANRFAALETLDAELDINRA